MSNSQASRDSDWEASPFPSSQAMGYCLDSQNWSRLLALLLSQEFPAVLSRALSPKMRSNPEQFVKENSRSTAYSEQRGKGHPISMLVKYKTRSETDRVDGDGMTERLHRFRGFYL